MTLKCMCVTTSVRISHQRKSATNCELLGEWFDLKKSFDITSR